MWRASRFRLKSQIPAPLPGIPLLWQFLPALISLLPFLDEFLLDDERADVAAVEALIIAGNATGGRDDPRGVATGAEAGFHGKRKTAGA